MTHSISLGGELTATAWQRGKPYYSTLSHNTTDVSATESYSFGLAVAKQRVWCNNDLTIPSLANFFSLHLRRSVRNILAARPCSEICCPLGWRRLRILQRKGVGIDFVDVVLTRRKT